MNLKEVTKFKEVIKFKNGHDENKKVFISSIINSSTPNFDFYIMVILASLITSLGIIADNLPLVIAGMIVAPLLSPILAMSLGFTIFKPKLIWRSIKIMLLSIILAMSISTLVGLLFKIENHQLALVDKMNISWLTFSIALAAGITASYAWTRVNSKDYLSGIAIAVTIIPPLTATGLSISCLDIALFEKVFSFFLMNLLGIFLGGIIVFPLMNFYKVKKVVDKEIKKEELHINS